MKKILKELKSHINRKFIIDAILKGISATLLAMCLVVGPPVFAGAVLTFSLFWSLAVFHCYLILVLVILLFIVMVFPNVRRLKW